MFGCMYVRSRSRKAYITIHRRLDWRGRALGHAVRVCSGVRGGGSAGRGHTRVLRARSGLVAGPARSPGDACEASGRHHHLVTGTVHRETDDALNQEGHREQGAADLQERVPIKRIQNGNQNKQINHVKRF